MLYEVITVSVRRLPPSELFEAAAEGDRSALAGMPLEGSGALQITGKLTPLSGAFDATIAGETRDLVTVV